MSMMRLLLLLMMMMMNVGSESIAIKQYTSGITLPNANNY